MIEITARKNHDYTSDSEDPFANFTMVERLGVCSTEQGLLARMSDKFMRLSTFIKTGTFQVKEEGFQDSADDLCNYAIILCAYLKSKRGASNDNLQNQKQG
jgi:hypothetical protein